MKFQVTCSDGQVRHEQPFRTRGEARTFAEWGHVCTSHHRIDIVPEQRRTCALCGGDGWTDSSAELRTDGHVGDTTCVACDGTGYER